MTTSVLSVLEIDGSPKFQLAGLIPWCKDIQTDFAPFLDTTSSEGVNYGVISVETKVETDQLTRTFRLKKKAQVESLSIPKLSASPKLSTEFCQLVESEVVPVQSFPDLLFEINMNTPIVVKGKEFIPGIVIYSFIRDNSGNITVLSEFLIHRGS